MPMEHLPHRGWTNVPSHKRIRGPVTLTEEQWSKLEKWGLELQQEASNERSRPKDREKAHYVLMRVAMLFRSLGFKATTGTLGLRVYEALTPEELAELRVRIDRDEDFFQEVQRGQDYVGDY